MLMKLRRHRSQKNPRRYNIAVCFSVQARIVNHFLSQKKIKLSKEEKKALKKVCYLPVHAVTYDGSFLFQEKKQAAKLAAQPEDGSKVVSKKEKKKKKDKA